jgi:Predicted metal-dependent phosphoesterases (PHP family)
MLADLHIHTTASDGVYTPEDIVKMAETAQLKAFAITDHGIY